MLGAGAEDEMSTKTEETVKKTPSKRTRPAKAKKPPLKVKTRVRAGSGTWFDLY